MQSLLDFLGQAVNWLFDLALWLPRKVVQMLLEPLGDWIHGLALPAGIDAGLSGLGSLPDSVGWFLSIMQFGPGLSMIVGAYLLRFTIRRIPLIG